LWQDEQQVLCPRQQQRHWNASSCCQSSLQNNSIWLWLLPLLLLFAGCSWQVVQQVLWPGQQTCHWNASS
jgi:hypothetical protein